MRVLIAGGGISGTLTRAALDRVLQEEAGRRGITLERGRRSTPEMVLVGDAAHAASPAAGQGASMALEDSVVLAQCLRDLPDPMTAFAAYEHLRRERVEKLVAANAGADVSEERGRLYSHHIDWDAKIVTSDS